MLNILQLCIDEEKSSRLLDIENFQEIVDKLSSQIQDLIKFQEDMSGKINTLEVKISDQLNTEKDSSEFDAEIRKLGKQKIILSSS